MKFGHVTGDEIDGVKFQLPPDHPDSILLQPNVIDNRDFQVFVGCGKWGIPAWVGPVYPEGTREKDYLDQYIKHFNSIELNGTFYRLSRNSIEKWSNTAQGTSLRFCPKWSHRITHLKRMKDIEENTQYFIDSIAALNENLGASFLTLPDNFGPKNVERVHAFLELVPDHYPIHIEFRHKDWFVEPVFSEIMQALEEKGIGTVITDVGLRRDVLHQRLTIRQVFVRFNGYSLHASDYMRLDDWIKRLVKWKEEGLQQVYFFMHQENEAHTPVLCTYFARKMNEIFGLQVPIPGS